MSLRVIVFDVQHGFCAFVKSPNGYSLMIDCGKGEEFSPVEYLLRNEMAGMVKHEGYSLTKLIVTHPHDDHIEDIQRVMQKFEPAMLKRQQYDWEDIKEPGVEEEYENLDTYTKWQESYNQPITNPPQWGMHIEIFSLSPSRAKKIDEAKYVNNSSIVVVATVDGTKFCERFLFGGDMEQAGWDELLKNESFRNAVKDVDFYVTSHHGHTSGFSTALFEAMGRPFVNIVSAHVRDKSVDARYSTEKYAIGTTLNGEERRMVTTRNDGSIFIDVNKEGKFSLHVHTLGSNIGKGFLLL